MPRWTRKQIETYTREMQAAMGLGDWNITIKFDDVGNNRSAQICVHAPEAKLAQLDYDEDDVLTMTRDRLRYIVSHELFHCVVGSYANQVERLIASLVPGPVGEALKEEIIVREEEVAHWFSRCISPTLPYIKA